MSRLHIDKNGKLAGTYRPGIEYNKPWPCPCAEWGSIPPYRGTILHTMVGNLPGTVQLFNDTDRPPNEQSSAHFGVDQNGKIHQFGPVTGGWVAWHCMAGNYDWFGVEMADNGDPNNPYTNGQIEAAALIIDAIHTHYNIPVKVTNVTYGEGIGTHNMGGAAWGGHSCPDSPTNPNHVRSAARAKIVDRVKQLRAGSPAPTAGEDEPEMTMLVAGKDGETVEAFPKGKFTKVQFGNDSNRTQSPAPKLRIAARSVGTGSWKVTNKTLPASGNITIPFGVTDADTVSIIRTNGDAGDNVVVGYRLE